jgi:hypothetical protein
MRPGIKLNLSVMDAHLHVRAFLAGSLASFILMIGCSSPETIAPDIVREQMRSSPPGSGVSLYQLDGPTDTLVSWIAAAHDELFAASHGGLLYKLDIRTNRWEQAGSGLPDDYAEWVAGTPAFYYAIGKDQLVYRRAVSTEKWKIEDPGIDSNSRDEPALLATVANTAVVHKIDRIACRLDSEVAWRQSPTHVSLTALHATNRELFAFRSSTYPVEEPFDIWKVSLDDCTLARRVGRHFSS